MCEKDLGRRVLRVPVEGVEKPRKRRVTRKGLIG